MLLKLVPLACPLLKPTCQLPSNTSQILASIKLILFVSLLVDIQWAVSITSVDPDPLLRHSHTF